MMAQQTQSNKGYDDDIPVCVCGKPFISKLVAECYDGSGVGCDECAKNIDKTERVYHCPADKNNILHSNGYDLCIPCYKKVSDRINTDNILFQIWFIINGLNKKLYQRLTSEHQIHTRHALVSKSSYEMFHLLQSVDWQSFSDETTMKLFCDRYDALKEKQANIKVTSYKYNGNNYPTKADKTQATQQNVNNSASLSWNASQNNTFSSGSNTNNNRNNSWSWSQSLNNNNNNSCTNRFSLGSNTNNNSNLSFGGAAATLDKNIGFSVGSGAKDINTFRLNIENHQIPSEKAISYQGVFSEYYFDTNPINPELQKQQQTFEGKEQDLPVFYPSYSCAKARVPKCLLQIKSQHNDMFSSDETDGCYTEYEYFLTVGLNSNIKEKDFKRKKLNLCVVLDISGSMGCSFGDSSFSWNQNAEDSKTSKASKMRVANECLLLLLTHLNSDDRFGLVLFDHEAQVKIQMDYMRNIEMEQIDEILDIRPRGATNMECGYNQGVNMYKNIAHDNEYENRLIFLTDAHPNEGRTDSSSLLNLVSRAANRINNKIYTSFIGIGLDFNIGLVSKLVNVRGVNQFSVHSNKEFKKKLHQEFEYFVSAMVFNLRLSLFCEGSNEGAIDSVYGSDNVDIQNGEIMKIKTLFPSPPNQTGDIKGGIVLIKLKYNNIMNKRPYFCEVTFEDKFGKINQHKQKIFLGDSHQNEFYPSLGVRKAILLVRYVTLIKDWIKKGTQNPVKYKRLMNEFHAYFSNEMKYVYDDTLQKEVKMLNTLRA